MQVLGTTCTDTASQRLGCCTTKYTGRCGHLIWLENGYKRLTWTFAIATNGRTVVRKRDIWSVRGRNVCREYTRQRHQVLVNNRDVISTCTCTCTAPITGIGTGTAIVPSLIMALSSPRSQCGHAPRTNALQKQRL